MTRTLTAGSSRNDTTCPYCGGDCTFPVCNQGMDIPEILADAAEEDEDE
jgi:predicted molibdopterin-dependent oxidoreductase YjgC